MLGQISACVMMHDELDCWHWLETVWLHHAKTLQLVPGVALTHTAIMSGSSGNPATFQLRLLHKRHLGAKASMSASFLVRGDLSVTELERQARTYGLKPKRGGVITRNICVIVTNDRVVKSRQGKFLTYEPDLGEVNWWYAPPDWTLAQCATNGEVWAVQWDDQLRQFKTAVRSWCVRCAYAVPGVPCVVPGA